MATRERPAWDLSKPEIDRLAKSAKVDKFFKAAQQQVRADAATASHAEREAFYAVAGNMTVDEIFAFSKAEALGLRPDIRDFVSARADSVTGDGLIQTTTLDASNRPVHTFRSVDGRKGWMRPYQATPGLMIALTNNTSSTRKQAQRYLSEHPAAIPM